MCKYSIYGSGGEVGIDLLSLSHTHTHLLATFVYDRCSLFLSSSFWTGEEKAVRDFFRSLSLRSQGREGHFKSLSRTRLGYLKGPAELLRRKGLWQTTEKRKK